jgi:AraC-like DNA-binding protein
MINQQSFFVILFSIPVYQLLFYTVQLLSFRRKNPSKKYLGLLLLSMTAFLVLNAVRSFGYDMAFSILYFLYLPSLLCVAPFFFLYILSITAENHDPQKKDRMVLFIPPALLIILNTILYLVIDNPTLSRLLDAGIFRSPDSETPMLLTMTLVLGILLVFFQMALTVSRAVKIIQKETEAMRLMPSHLAYIEWKWILAISLSVLIFLVINSLSEFIFPVKSIGIAVLYNILMLFAGGITGYFGMKQDNLLNQVMNLGKPQVSQAPLVERSMTPEATPVAGVITEPEADEYIALIHKIMDDEKPYTRSDYSIIDLSHRLNLSRRKLSYLINDVMGKNFYGLVNEYRIRDAENMLKEESMPLKIEALGEAVGFTSKSSFNACFKKYTGMTPSEYRNFSRAK